MRRLIEFFVNNKLIVNVFLVLIFALGLYFSLFKIKRETLPKVDFNIVIISTLYPGAAPIDVELNISKKIEEELKEVDGIDKFLSTSSDNVSTLVVWIDIDEDDPEKVKNEIKKAVDRAEVEFPEKAEKPEINEIKSENVPIIRYILSSSEIPESELRMIAKNFEDEIEDIEGVARVDKMGYRDPEIKVMGDIVKMKTNDISLQDLANSIKNYNIRSGGGTLESHLAEKSIVTVTEFTNIEEVKNVIIRSNFEGMKIRIKDVAKVKRDYEDRTIYARGNQHNGIVLSVLKKENYDIIRIVDKVKEKVENCKCDIIAKYKDKLNISSIHDITKNTRRLLSISRNNALIGFVLVILTLIIFLEWRVAFWTAFGIPVALMMVFIFMIFLDFSINNISLFGIITVLGILVDDGIVAAENIHRKKELGQRGKEAAVAGSYEVFYPLLGTVLTTILAFLPLAFMGGIMGKFVFELPIVIIIALTASLIEVFFALPSHLSREPKKKGKKLEARKWFQKVHGFYKKILIKALKLRYLVIIIFIILLFLAFNVLKTMRFILFSREETERIILKIEAPEGTSLNAMLEKVTDIEKLIVKKVPYKKEMDSILTIIGTTIYNIAEGGGKAGNNTANIQIFLVPFANRKRIAAQMVEDIRKDLKKFTFFKKIIITEWKPGPPVGKPIDIKIISNNDTIRNDISDKLKDFLKEQDGVFSIEDDRDQVKKEIRVQFDFAKMYRLGVNPFIVASTIRMAYKGEKASSIVKSDEDIEIVVSLKKEYKRDIKFLKQLLIPSRYGKQIRLYQVATFPVEDSNARILRYNGKRAATITADVDEKKTTPMEVFQKIIKKYGPEIAANPQVRIKVGGEIQSGEESINNAKIAFQFAILGIFMVLLLIFRSLSQPLLVLLVIPFGLIGIIFSFKLHGEPMGFFGMIGAVGLAGVVVNDSIVMVDFMNRLKKSIRNRAEMFSKVVFGASERLRPILLTTITTVMGLVPTVYGFGGKNSMLKPLTMAIAYGLLFGTTITLFLIPSLYMIDYDIKCLFRKLGSKLKKEIYKIRSNDREKAK